MTDIDAVEAVDVHEETMGMNVEGGAGKKKKVLFAEHEPISLDFLFLESMRGLESMDGN